MPGQARLSDLRVGLVRWHSQAGSWPWRQTNRQTATTLDESSSTTATAVGVATIASRKEAPREAATCCWWESISEQKKKRQRGEFKFCAQLCSHKCKQSRKKTFNSRRQKSAKWQTETGRVRERSRGRRVENALTEYAKFSWSASPLRCLLATPLSPAAAFNSFVLCARTSVTTTTRKNQLRF